MKTIYLAVCTVLLAGCGNEPKAPEPPTAVAVPVLSLATKSQNTYQEYPASIQGSLNVEIRPQVSGSLERVYVDEGAYVQAGQPVFKVDEQPFRAALNNAKASLQAAESALVNAELEINKLKPLVENNVVSDYQLKSATAAANVARAEVARARANVTTANINLGYTLIKAPVSGYISLIKKKRGSLVGPGDAEPLTQLSDVKDVHVYFTLSETDFVHFKSQYPGGSLAEKLSKMPSVELLLPDNTIFTRTGKIDMIDGQFNATTGSITIRAKFPNPNGLLRSGNTGKVRLSLKHSNIITVPQECTVEMQDKVFVYALTTDNKVRMQAISIDGKSGNDYLIKEGLSAGDRIVLSGFGNLKEGSLVKPQPATTINPTAKR